MSSLTPGGDDDLYRFACPGDEVKAFLDIGEPKTMGYHLEYVDLLFR